MFKLLLVLSFSFSASFMFSQQDYTWDEYQVSFTLADDFEEVTNDADEFSAIGDGMEISILPFNDETIDQGDITAFTMTVAASLELDRVDDVSEIEINSFDGAYAEGEIDGTRVFMMGLIDPDSETNLFVIITFLDDDQNAVDEAVNICLSFDTY